MAVIAGPTASGKSALALAVAARVGGVIINADASQLYADLRIVSARPSADEEALVPHRLYGVLDGDDGASAARWADMAKAAIAEAQAEGRLPILVGGTGMYLATLIHGIAPVPEIDPVVRATVCDLATAEAAAALVAEDPALAARLMAGDRQRISRGLEVVRSTGRSLLHWQATRVGGIGEANVCAVVVDVPRAVLNARAETRLRQMVEAGALAEVAALLARGLPANRPVLRALGVPELAAVLDGSSTLEAAVTTAATATRQYQKRQLTWARNQVPDWPRIDPVDGDAAATLVTAMFTASAIS